MSEYQTSRRGLPVFFLFLIVLLPALGWYSYSNLTDNVINTLRKTTSLNFENDDGHFDLFSKRLTLQDVSLSQPGMEVSARSVDVRLKYSSWLDIWLSRAPVSIGDVSVQDARIKITSAQVTSLKLKPEQTITIDRGTLVINGLDKPVIFSEIILFPVLDEGFNLKARGVGEQPWLFDGQLTTKDLFLIGQLELSERPLSLLIHDSADVYGTYNASLSVEFSQQGVSFEGGVEGGEGLYELNGSTLSWKHWQLNDFRYVLAEEEKPEVELTLSGIDLALSSVDVGKPYLFPIEVLNQFPVTPTIINAPDGSFRINDSSWLLRNVFLSTQEGSGTDLSYRLNADLQSGGQMSFLGVLAEGDSDHSHHYQLQLNNIVLDESWSAYRVVDGYDLKGSYLSLVYDSIDQAGTLTVEKWQYQAVSDVHQLSMDYLKHLLTNKQGVSVTPFSLSPSVTANQFAGSVQQAVFKEWEKIAAKPLQYLALVIDDQLSSTMTYYAGKHLLTDEGLENLNKIKALLAVRPNLKLLVSVSVSEQHDWNVLAQKELNQSLTQLYKALEPEQNEPVPVELRGQLVEQIYLNTQKQKIPEVGEKNVQDRQNSAERWLLDHWPKNPVLLTELQQLRIQQMRRQLSSMGFTDRQYEVKAARTGQPEAVVQLR